jgi:hypothetical protein
VTRRANPGRDRPDQRSAWRCASTSHSHVGYEHPEVLAELRNRLDAWEADVDSRPVPFVVK